MTAYEIIARKRDGLRLVPEEIDYFISAFMRGDIAAYQLTALLMAIYLRGMDYEETSALTRAYISSGAAIDLSDIPGIKVDKHSTGGVGDKVSIVLAPLVASSGVPVPMISGRGLGHSGGTLDKLESIPGFQIEQSIENFKQLLREVGVALIGQSDNIVAADKQIYALRDVTATVDCIPLISASIMSKKIAEGIDGLVVDVKYGNGAFMKEIPRAEELARNLIKIGQDFKIKVVAVLSSMEQPLGYKIGNWLEIEECLDCFAGRGPQDLLDVTLELASQMLLLGGVARSGPEAFEICRRQLQSGKAFEKFLEVARAQGADTRFLSHPEKYPPARETDYLIAERDGYLVEMNTFQIGMAAVELGAGRFRAEDAVDPRAGIELFKKLGDRVSAGDRLLKLHTNRTNCIEPALQRLRQALIIDETPREVSPLILKKVS